MTIRQDIATYRRGLAGLLGTVADDLNAPTLGDMLSAGERVATAMEPLLALTGNPIGEAEAAALEIRTLQAENARFRRLVGRLLAATADDWDEIDDEELIEWMSEAGVLEITTMRKPCSDECRCFRIGAGFPVHCYQPTELGAACLARVGA